jgi:hypothetical protein
MSDTITVLLIMVVCYTVLIGWCILVQIKSGYYKREKMTTDKWIKFIEHNW